MHLNIPKNKASFLLITLGLLSGLFTVLTIGQEAIDTSYFDQLDISFSRCMETIRTSDFDGRIAGTKRLEESLASFLSVFTAYGGDSGKMKTDSNDSIVPLVYPIFVGDIIFYERLSKDAELTEDNQTIVVSRARSLLSAYPLSSPISTTKERVSLILFLSHLHNAVPKNARTILINNAAHIQGLDRLPVLVALEGMGDDDASTSLERIDKQYASEVQRLRHIFRLYMHGN
ncbi:MAG: hypothetical protein PHG55_09125 [Verrucomicrobiota bacterium]|jgi:hypothetical protein|nr:hypothetical protein [Verrucomicrobiota bacterium]